MSGCGDTRLRRIPARHTTTPFRAGPLRPGLAPRTPRDLVFEAPDVVEIVPPNTIPKGKRRRRKKTSKGRHTRGGFLSRFGLAWAGKINRDPTGLYLLLADDCAARRNLGVLGCEFARVGQGAMESRLRAPTRFFLVANVSACLLFPTWLLVLLEHFTRIGGAPITAGGAAEHLPVVLEGSARPRQGPPSEQNTMSRTTTMFVLSQSHQLCGRAQFLWRLLGVDYHFCRQGCFELLSMPLVRTFLRKARPHVHFNRDDR